MQILKKRRAYVAAKLEDYMEAREAMDLLTAAGYIITHDWTMWLVLPQPETSFVTSDAKACRAHMDTMGAANCDVLVILAKEGRQFKGTYCELGIALASGAIVFVVGHGMDDCLFVHHRYVNHVETINDAVQELLRIIACQAGKDVS